MALFKTLKNKIKHNLLQEAQNCRRGSRKYGRRRGINGRQGGPRGLDETFPGFWDSHEIDFLPPPRPFSEEFYFERQYRPSGIDDSLRLNPSPKRDSRRRKQKPAAGSSDFRKDSSAEESSDVEPYVNTKTKPNQSGSSKTNKISSADKYSSTTSKSAAETYQWTIQKPVKPSNDDYSFYIRDDIDDEEDNDDNNMDDTKDYRW
ncbi:hypothetical protein J6590_059445 [Homalodisca vitripennis]|nr:hypothetical protein J6590_059445 [Homalodisca vitripennis]